MNEVFNNSNQIQLFSREALILSEGYRNMARFRFDEAKRFFDDVLKSGPNPEDSEAAQRALKLCGNWQPLVSQAISTEPSLFGDSTILYREFRAFDFTNTPGEQQFREALLLLIINRMLDTGCFHTGEGGITVADLLRDLGRHKKAKETIRKQMEGRPDDHYLIYCLAQIQWSLKNWGEAKKKYALALLHDPCGLPPERVEYKELTTLIQNEGPEMAPAFGWVRGVLPLVPPPDGANICSGAHRHAVECYRLLWRADRALRRDDIDARVEYRKKLNAEAPALYDEYFALFKRKE